VSEKLKKEIEAMSLGLTKKIDWADCCWNDRTRGGKKEYLDEDDKLIFCRFIYFYYFYQL
jgi:hypothetical protein